MRSALDVAEHIERGSMEAHQALGYMEERRHGSRLKPPGSAGNMPTKLLNWIVDCIMCETGDLGPGKMERVRVAAVPVSVSVAFSRVRNPSLDRVLP